jgi:hypothetical protein
LHLQLILQPDYNLHHQQKLLCKKLMVNLEKMFLERLLHLQI